MAVISSDGTVLWITTAIFKTTCSTDVTHFPFDEQTCYFKFRSWTHNGFQVDIDLFDDLQLLDITDYIPSNEWAVLEHPAKKITKVLPCCIEPYPELAFTLKLKRIATFYNYILILPCVLLSSLTLVIFWLPPESSGKMMLGKLILLPYFIALLSHVEVEPY